MPPETTTTHLKLLIASDLAASNDLAARITQLRNAIDAGQPPPRKTVDLMDRSNRDITQDLVRRIENIEPTTRTGQDEELLHALNARLAVCDGLAMRLAELRDLLTSASKISTYHNASDRHSPKDSRASPRSMGEQSPEPQVFAPSALPESHENIHHLENDDAHSEPDPDPKTYPLLYRILLIPPSTPAPLMPSVAKSYAPPFPPRNPHADLSTEPSVR